MFPNSFFPYDEIIRHATSEGLLKKCLMTIDKHFIFILPLETLIIAIVISFNP